MNVTWFDL